MSINYVRKTAEKDEERPIILGMIISTEFLHQIRDIYKPEYFTHSYARTVADWIMEYYGHYNKAPVRDIKSLYENKKEYIYDEGKQELIATFLESIGNEYDESDNYNVEYHFNNTKVYFKKRSLEILMEEMKGAWLVKDFEKCESLAAGYKRVEKISGSAVDVWTDKEAVIRTLRGSSDENTLLVLPGQLGQFIRPLTRSDFVAVVGAAKRGKTQYLNELAALCSLNRLNVAYFSFEMKERDILLRLYQRATGRLKRDIRDSEDDLRIINFPYFDGDGNVHVRQIQRGRIDIQSTMHRLDAVNLLAKGKKFKLKCAPSKSMKVSDIDLFLDNLEYYEGFVPDVIISDYADITAPEKKSGNERDNINDVWLGYRALGQKRDCLVITGSHSNKLSFDRDIRQGDLTEDIRKLNHVTLALSLNQTDEEKMQGIMRMSVLADRVESFASTEYEAVLLQCLDIGQPLLDSRIRKKQKKEI